MKNLIGSFLLAFVFSFGHLFAQSQAEGKTDKAKAQSEFSKMIGDISFSKLELDESEKAVFKSGTGEFVEFYPATFTNLKTGQVTQALKIVTLYDLMNDPASALGGISMGLLGNKSPRVLESAFMDASEIEQLVEFFEKFVNPNLDTELGKKNQVIYGFKSKELEIRLLIGRDGGKTKELLEIAMVNRPYYDKYFWTKSQVSKTAEVVKTLKYIVEKAKSK